MEWYIVLNVVNVTKNKFVRQPGCWVPGSENIQMENTSTLPLRNTPLPPVIITHRMTPRSYLREKKWFLQNNREALHIHKRSLVLKWDWRHEIPTILLQLLLRDPPLMWQATTIIKDWVTQSKHLGMFQTSFCVINSFIYNVKVDTYKGHHLYTSHFYILTCYTIGRAEILHIYRRWKGHNHNSITPCYCNYTQ